MEFFAQYGLPAVVVFAFLAYVIPQVVKYLDTKNKRYENIFEEQTKNCQSKVENMIREHREEVMQIAQKYEERLEKKDERIHIVVNSTYKAIHEMTQALEKNTETMARLNEKIRPVEEILPKVITLTDRINELYNSAK